MLKKINHFIMAYKDDLAKKKKEKKKRWHS